MTKATSRTLEDGEGVVVPLPDAVSVGPDVDVLLSREGDVVTMRRLRPNAGKGEPSDSGD